MPHTSRRQFAKALSALPLAASTSLLAQAAPEEPPTSALAVALTGVVRAQSWAFLDDEEMSKIGKDLQEWVPAVERLRQFKLANSDEPDFSFSSLARRW
jgi:hypothetical protein